MHTSKPAEKPLIHVLKHIWDNIENYLTILGGIGLSIYTLVWGNLTEPKLIAAVTALLALIAWGLIRDRLDKKELKQTAEKLIKPPKASDVLLVKYDSLEDTFGNGEEIWMTGASLIHLIGTSQPILEHAICEHKARVKIVILDEESPMIASAAKCIGTEPVILDNGQVIPAEDTMRREILQTQVVVQAIKNNTRGAAGTIELRQITYYPTYTMVMINPHRPDGFMTLEPIGYKKNQPMAPHLRMNQKDDPFWMDYYRRQFNELWEDAHVPLSRRELHPVNP